MKERSRGSSFIRHQVRVKLEGFKPEKLISQAMAKRITIRQISYKDETEVCFTVTDDGYQTLRKMAGSKYRLTVLQERGTVPAAKGLKKKKMMIVGVAIFVMFFIAQSFFVREVRIVGNQKISESEIRQCIEEEGLYEGALKRFDCDSIERKLFKQFDEIVWARVAYEGNFVQVEISESKQVKTAEISRKPCHIVAEQDCYIERILSYTGRPVVAKDDFVKKGQILITGILPIDHSSYQLEEKDSPNHYVHASGKITARVPYYFSFFMEEGSTEEEANAHLRLWISENIPEKAQILNKSLNFDKKKNIIRVYGTIETRQLVGKEQEISIAKEKRRTEKNNH